MKPLPCPFCGAVPEVGPLFPEIEGNAWGYVRCVKPRCVAHPIVHDGEASAHERGSDLYKDAAIKRWNTRS